MCINNTSFAHRHQSISTPLFLFVICDGYRRFAQSSALLQTLNRGLSVSLGRWHSSQANCKICLKSAGLNAFFWLDLCCVALFEGKSPLKECLSRQETIGQHYPMNWSKIGLSINELSVKFIAHIKHLHTCLAETMNFPETGKFIGWNIIIRLLSANKDFPVYFWNHGKFQINLIFY